MAKNWNSVYYKRRALNEEYKSMFGSRQWKDLSTNEKKVWANHENMLTKEIEGSSNGSSNNSNNRNNNAGAKAIGAGAAIGGIGMGIKGGIIKQGIKTMGHIMRENYDRGFNAYRAPKQYTNYSIKPIWVKRRYTKAYRANMNAYHLPFSYSKAGPAYQHNRRTRNFWRWGP